MCWDYSGSIKIWKNITGTLLEDQYTILIISHWVLLRMKSVSDKVVGKIKTHILCSLTFFFNCAICEIMWKYIVEPGRPEMTIWCMHAGYLKATNTLSEYVIFIAFHCNSGCMNGLIIMLYMQCLSCLFLPSTFHCWILVPG